jgi:uncharacterized protein YqeY
MIEVDKLIASALKERNEVKTAAYRAIKTAEMNYKTAKNAKPLDDAAEIQIIKKLVTQREESANIYKENDRPELAEREEAEIKYLKELLPPEVSQDDIIAAVIAWAVAESNGETIPKARMGEAIKAVKAKFPTADGKLVADCVKERLV